MVRYKKCFFERKDAKLVPLGGSHKVANETCRFIGRKTESFCLSVLSLVIEYKVFKT